MDSLLSFASMNCRGLGEAKKRRDVFHYLRNLHFSFYFLQDTHFHPSLETLIKNEWGNDVYFSSFSSNSRGVAILINNNIEFKILNTIKDIGGNYLVLHIKMFEREFLLINVYGPNRDNPEFYEHLEEEVLKFDHVNNFIFAGDWNLIRNFDLDCFNYRHHNNIEACKQVDDLMINLDLCDIWRANNQDVKRFTWRKPTPLQQSRLDYFLISESLSCNTHEVDIKPGYRTDHSLVTLSLKFGDDGKRSNLWKFNNSLLFDKNYLDKINSLILKTKQEYAVFPYNIDTLSNVPNHELCLTISDQTFLDTLLMKIRESTIFYSIDKKRKLNEKETKLKQIIESLDKKTHLNENEKLTLEQTNEELISLREIRMRGVLVRSRARWVEDGEKITSYFCGLEKRNYTNKRINMLTKPNGEDIKDNKTIVEEVKLFYENLYKSRDIRDLRISDLVENIPVLNENDANQLEGELTFEEISYSLKNMKNDKSPGSDGYTVEFFKVFWGQLGQFILRSLNEGFRKGELSNTQKEGVIICIPKVDKPRNFIKNWRPISLLNIIYKIGSASIANRLKLVLPSLIHEDQTGFISGRFIGDNIRLIYDIINYLTNSNSPGLLLNLDFEKAFDSLEWSFLFKVLKAFGFKDGICNWVKTFYKNIKSVMSVNGLISSWFNVTRGCRQGDPISPYLFILSVEIMAIMIRENDKVKGVVISDVETKLSQYADDSEVILGGDRESFEETVSTINLFGEVSGLKLNYSKTSAIWLGSMRNSDIKYSQHLDIDWNPSKFKILGIWFTNDLRDCVSLNFREKFLEVKNLYKIWLKRQITPLGRVAILKSLILSKLVYLWILLPNPPDNQIDELQKSIFRFVWGNKNDRINRNASVQNIENGGIGIPDVRQYIKSLKLTWIRKLNNSNHKWKILFSNMYPHLENLNCFGASINIEMLNENSFWANVFHSYKEFGKKVCIKTKDHLLNEPLFHNENFKIGNSTFFFEHWFFSGIVFVKDLLHNDGSFLSFQELKNKYYLDEANFLNYYGCVEAVKRKKRNLNVVFDDNCNNTKHLTIETILSVHKGSNKYYNIFIGTENIHSYCRKWDAKLNTNLKWSNIFLQVQSIKEIKFRWFYVRVLTRILGTNVTLKAIGLRNDDLCTFCHVTRESIVHLFTECNVVNQFWFELKQLLSNNNIVSQNFDFTPTIILFGESNAAPGNRMFFYVLVLAKYFIYRCRFQNTAPTVLNFVHYLKNQYTILKHIAMKNQNTEKFENEWEIWIPLLS